MKIIALFLSYLLVDLSKALNCNEEAYCLTFPKDSITTYCAAFLKVPCPETCGKCASQRLKVKFSSAFDTNSDSKITLEEAQNALKGLSVNMEDALVTDIKDLIFDTKATITDLFVYLDVDKDAIVTVKEFFNGLMNLAETIGVTLKPELRQTITYMADIIQISNEKRNEVNLPKLTDMVQIITGKLIAYPHGLVSLLRLQNLTLNKIDFERIITTQQLSYTLNTRTFIWTLLNKIDRNDDDYICVRELLGALLTSMEMLDVTIPAKVHDNLNVFLLMIENSMKTLLTKYGYTDMSQLDGKILSDLNNQKFVDPRIKIKEAIANAKIIPSATIMKYLKAPSNGIPQKKLTPKSISEAIFIGFDKNKDYELDLIEFSEFALVGLPKIGAGLQDYTEALKIAKLYDDDNDDKIDMKELIDMLKADQMPK